MKIVEAGYEVLYPNSDQVWQDMHLLIERCARMCYKSTDKIEPGSADKLLKRLKDYGHLSMLEHALISVKFISDIGVSREMHRHRLASHAEESTRYVNYSKDKFGHEITVIAPPIPKDSKEYWAWMESCEQAEFSYMQMIELGCKPQIARSVLPLCTKTEYVVTANPREWMLIQKLRDDPAAHPQMRSLVHPLFVELGEKMPVLFAEAHE